MCIVKPFDAELAEIGPSKPCSNWRHQARRICYVVLLSCEFSIDTARVELKCSDGSMRAINCCAVEDEYAKTIRQRSALD